MAWAGIFAKRRAAAIPPGRDELWNTPCTWAVADETRTLIEPMENPRIHSLREMIERNPDDPRLRFGLAAEYEKLERWEQVVDELERYLELTEDEGNAWGRLGHALRQVGRETEAIAAYDKGAEVARAHGHPTMAAEFEEVLEEWD